MPISINDITLETLLTVDTHGQEITLTDNRSSQQYKLIESRKEFFSPNGLFADVEEDGIAIIENNDTRVVNLSSFYNEINNKHCSSIILIEGFAGCGKSTLVQYILSNQLKTYNYDYNLYNYDLEAQNDINIRDKNGNVFKKSSIFEAIKKCFFKQFMDMLKKNKSIFDDFNYLLLKCKDFQPFDSLYYKFYLSDTYKEIINNVNDSSYILANGYDTIEENLVKQAEMITSSTCIFALDSLLRLAIHKNNTNDCSKIYLCYDNLDAIEDAEDLKGFDNKLMDYAPIIDKFISEIDINYSFFKNITTPTFVVMITYRKITATLAEISKTEYREVRIDKRINTSINRVLHIDATSAFKYNKIVKKRFDYFSVYLKNAFISEEKKEKLLDSFNSWNTLNQNLAIMDNRYSCLWNKNYRTCSRIANDLYTEEKYGFHECVELIKQSNTHDGYISELDQEGDKVICSYYGSSAILLNSVCKVFHSNHIWDDFLDLAALKKPEITYRNISLSRMILTYIYNNGETTISELYNTFCKNRLFTYEKMCGILSKMLARNLYGVWRRPIYYANECILTDEVDKIKNALKNECKFLEFGKEVLHNYSFLLCDSGKAYVERLMQEFEFFSNRISNSNKPLYLYNNIEEIDEIIDSVYNAVSRCCDNMIKFSERYMAEYKLSKEEYLKLYFHPRTNNTKTPQLHTERTIFSHIAYLNNVRLYFLTESVTGDITKRKAINRLFVKYIEAYLKLYNKKITPLSSKRKNIADRLNTIISEIKNEIEKGENQIGILFQSISLHHK